MADSKTVIANMALSHLGEGNQISALDTENSEEAKACRQFYDTARKICLRDFDWAFSETRGILAQIENLQAADDKAEWNFSYQYPTDCLKLRRIESGLRNDNRQSRIAYTLFTSGTNKLIYTDCDEARIVYTKDVSDVTLFTADFDLALSYKLAELIAPRITAGDVFQMKTKMREMYEIEITNAQANDQGEVQHEEVPQSEFERARGYYYGHEEFKIK